MKKILLLCDGDNFPSGAMRFIRQINSTEPVFVKGIFFSTAETLEIIPIGFIPVSGPYRILKDEELIKVHQSKKKFTESLENIGIRYDVQSYEGAWDAELFKTESRFADLVVFSAGLFFKDALENQPNYFMAEALRSSECPVMVIPENFKYVERLAIAYDGEKESMHAIKQFLYLFPDLCDLTTEIVYVKDDATEEIPNRDLLREYTFSHFQAQNTAKLHFNPKIYLTGWLEDKKNALLITGSYSRSAFSNSMHKSFAEKTIAEQTCPVFMAHFS